MIAATLFTVLLLPFVLVATPWLKLEFRRRASRSHRPMPMELWMQDDALLYIESSDATGLHLLSFDPATHVVTRWTDTWDAWHARCRARVVVFSGRTGSLNPWDTMRT